jgi:uncharacterized Zn finger protein (UPF0148 family)
MRALTNPELLDLWERASGLHQLDRALLAIAATETGEPYAALADWPLGRRNAALARLRRECFGSALTGWVACPQCGERLEFSLDMGMLLKERGQQATQLSAGGSNLRAITSRDLASAAAEIDERAAAQKLLSLCSGQERDFTDDELEALGERLAEADPLAETLLDFACAACDQRWQEPLDIAAWLWAEIEARARRLLYDVHTLAAAYGWTEHEILSLSEPRRAVYLEMAHA